MLNYQTTSFHDALYAIEPWTLRAAPEFEEWLVRMQIISAGEPDVRLNEAVPPLCSSTRFAGWIESAHEFADAPATCCGQSHRNNSANSLRRRAFALSRTKSVANSAAAGLPAGMRVRECGAPAAGHSLPCGLSKASGLMVHLLNAFNWCSGCRPIDLRSGQIWASGSIQESREILTQDSRKVVAPD
jgi:hypothetical protein